VCDGMMLINLSGVDRENKKRNKQRVGTGTGV